MKNIALLVLLMSLFASAENINFFGLKTEGNPVDYAIALLDGLIDGNQEEVDTAYAKIKKIDPDLARAVKLDELKVPCTRCNGTGQTVTGKACGKCSGTGLMTDPNSLRFFMDRFSTALSDDRTVAEAWKIAADKFNEYRERLTTKEVLFGTVIRKEKNGLLLSLRTNKKVYLKDVDVTQNFKGTPISGSAWLEGTYTYTNSNGETNTVPSYTANLWGS